ncbi:MAG: CDP-diacylglycerol--serine O-phosphatidyltransferase [Planctomycetota bacterium]
MKPKLKRLKGVDILPSLLTLGNLVSGFGAIYYLMKLESDYVSAAWLIFLAMAFDMLDGKIARYTKTASNFGVHLDSLSDIVSFGLTPALLMLKIVCTYHSNIPIKFIWVAAAFYLVCAALRLARFNVETTTSEEEHQYFLGLPTPGAAALLASIVVVYTDKDYSKYNIGVIISVMPFLTILLAALMISRFRYAHFLNRFLRVRSFIQLVYIILLAFCISVFHLPVTMSLIFLAYVLSGPISYFGQKIFFGQKVTTLVESVKDKQL